MNKIFFTLSFLVANMAFASDMGIAVQFRLKSPSGIYPTETALTMKLQVLTVGTGCVLREELFNNQTISDGTISLKLGTGQLSGLDPNLSLNQVFDNKTSKTNLSCVDITGATVASNQTYSPLTADHRVLRFTGVVSGQPIQADFPMRSVPYAIQAESVGGKNADDILVRNTSTDLNQANLETLFANPTNTTNILNFAATGTVNTATTSTSFTGPLAGDITGTQAATSLSKIKGVTVSATAPTTGQALVYNGTQYAPATVSTPTASGVTAGTYGTATQVGQFTVDTLGRLTSASNLNIAIPASQITQSSATTNQVLKWNGTAWAAANDSNSGGSVTNVNSANAYLTITLPSTTPVLTLNVGTAANTVAAGNDTRITGALQSATFTGYVATAACTATQSMYWDSVTSTFKCQTIGTVANATNFTGALAGDVSGTQAATSVDKIKGHSVSATAPNSGEVLKWNGTAWAPGTDASSGGTVTNVTSANSYLSVATGTTTPVLTLNVGTAANTIAAGDDSRITGALQQTAFNGYVAPATCTSTESMYWNSVTSTFACQTIGTVANATNAVNATNATTAVNFSGALAGDVSGTQAAVVVNKIKGVAVSATAPTTGQALIYNGTQYAPSTLTGGTVTNVSSANSYLSVATGTTTPALTLNVGTAANTVAAGNDSRITGALQSATFTGYVATAACTATQSMYWDSVTSTFKCQTIGTVAAATTATTATNFSGALTGDISGTQTATSVDKIKGSAVSATAPTTGQVLKWSGTAWAPAADANGGGTVTSVTSANSYLSVATGTTTPALTLNVGTAANTVAAGNDSRITGALQQTAFNGYVSPANCTSTQTMYWNSVSSTFSCQTIGTVAAATTATTATTATSFSGALTGDISGTQTATSVDKIKGVTVGATAPTTGQVLAYDGSQYTPTNGLPSLAKSGADQTFTTTTLTNATSLSFNVTAGKTYKYNFNILYTSAATNTGLKVSITYPAATTASANARIPVATADGTGYMYHGLISTSGDAVTATGSPAATTPLYANVEGIIIPSASGTVQLQAASETNGSNIILKSGSYVEVTLVQ